MLNRRKNKDQMKNYFEQIEDGRKKKSVEAAKTSVWQKSMKGDVLEEWKQAKARGEIKPLGYEAEPDRSTSLFGNIIVPGNPIGMPRMDNGERFDLRLPYAERGYEDPDSDVMGKLFSMFSPKKKEPPAPAKNAPVVSKKANDKNPPTPPAAEKKKGWW